MLSVSPNRGASSRRSAHRRGRSRVAESRQLARQLRGRRATVSCWMRASGMTPGHPIEAEVRTGQPEVSETPELSWCGLRHDSRRPRRLAWRAEFVGRPGVSNRRPRDALLHRPPLARLCELNENNLLGSYNQSRALLGVLLGQREVIRRGRGYGRGLDLNVAVLLQRVRRRA